MLASFRVGFSPLATPASGNCSRLTEHANELLKGLPPAAHSPGRASKISKLLQIFAKEAKMLMNIAKLRDEQASRTVPKLTEGPADGWDEVGAMWRDFLVWRGWRSDLRSRDRRILEDCTRCCCCSCTGRALLVGGGRFCNFAGKGGLLLRPQDVSDIVRSCSIGHRRHWRVASLVSSEIVLWPSSRVDAGAPLHPLRGCSWVYRRGVIFARACRRVILHRDSHSRLIARNLVLDKNSR